MFEEKSLLTRSTKACKITGEEDGHRKKLKPRGFLLWIVKKRLTFYLSITIFIHCISVESFSCNAVDRAISAEARAYSVETTIPGATSIT